jgi:hypothetical protein
MPLKQSSPDELNAFLEKHPFDEAHAYLFIRHDQSVVTIEQIRRTVGEAGVAILDVAVVSKGPSLEQSVLIKLDARDAREIVLRIAKHELIAIEGYNAGKAAIHKH